MIEDTNLPITIISVCGMRSAANFLAMSKSVFYLCGSRYYRQHHADSDWDFVSQYSVELEKELVDYGFSILHDTTRLRQDRPNNNSRVILEYQGVQVNLVDSLDIYLKIRDMLYDSEPLKNYHYLLNSNERQVFWDKMTFVMRRLRYYDL